MGFFKKVLVLRQTETGYSVSDKPLSGICRVEIENGVAQLFLTVVNIKPIENSTYKIMTVDGSGKTFTFDLGKRPTSSKIDFPSPPDAQNGFAAGLFSVREDIPATVAFAADGFEYSLSDFKRLVAEKCLAARKNATKKEPIYEPQKDKPLDDPAPVRPPYPPAPEPDPTATPPQEFPSPKSGTVERFYDDEAVATANYYEFDEQINDRLTAVKGWNDERIRLANEQTFEPSKKEEIEVEPQNNFFENEADLSLGEEYSENSPFYETVRNDLSGVFDKYGTECGLEKMFPDSRWAKINYVKDKYYVVGLIKESGKEKYVCYGVPATYSPKPPKELKGYCTFIPLSIFDLSGEGFWMMFQDAVTGECIRPKPPFD